MALTIKTIVKLYLLFFVFQISCNIFIEVMPTIHTVSTDNQEFLTFLNTLVNGEFDTEATGKTLLTNFRNSIETTDLFNAGVVNAFLGVLQVIGSVILFIVQLAINILFIPSIMLQILFYNFIVSGYFFIASLIVNIFFYMNIFHIIFKRRISP